MRGHRGRFTNDFYYKLWILLNFDEITKNITSENMKLYRIINEVGFSLYPNGRMPKKVARNTIPYICKKYTASVQHSLFVFLLRRCFIGLSS